MEIETILAELKRIVNICDNHIDNPLFIIVKRRAENCLALIHQSQETTEVDMSGYVEYGPSAFEPKPRKRIKIRNKEDRKQ